MKGFKTYDVALKATIKRKFVPALLLVLGSFIFITAASAANIVVNGGFENPVVPDGVNWATYSGENFDPADTFVCPPGDIHCYDGNVATVPGWSVFWTDDIFSNEQLTPGRLELQRDGPNGEPVAGVLSFSGEQKAELDSHHRDNGNTNVTIAQLPQSCPRTAYQLSYAWKSRTDLPGDNDVRVTVDGTNVRQHSQNNAWEKETVNFVSNNLHATLLIFTSVGTTTTHGMFLDDVAMEGPDASDPANCEQPAPICELGKPSSLTMLYDGNDLSLHNQAGNEVIITPETVSDYPNPALIRVYGHKKKNPKVLSSTTVQIGETFNVSGSRYRIPSRLKFEIVDPNTGDVVQTVQFHSSCSQPLAAYDEFGGLTVWSADH